MSTYEETVARLRKQYINNTDKETTETESSSYEKTVAALKKKYSPANNAIRTQAVTGWHDRYNKAIQGITDYTKQRNGGYTLDASGGYSAEIDSLISDYEGIREYADRFGLPNAQRYLEHLQKLKEGVAQDNAYFASFASQEAYEQYQKTLQAEEEFLASLPEQSRATFKRTNDLAREKIRKGEDVDPGVVEESLELTGNNILAGLNSFNAGLFQTADAVLGKFTQATGSQDNPISSLAKYYSGLRDQYTTAAEQNKENLGGGAVLDTVSDITQGVFGAVPDALLAVMTAGGSKVATATSLATNAAKQGGNLLTKAGLTVEAMMKNPQYWLSFGRTYGAEYEEAKENGADDTVAAFSAMITSLINSGIEIGIDGASGIQGLPQDVIDGGSSAVMDWVKSSLEEGGEEVLQSFVTDAVAKVAYDHDRPLATTEGIVKDFGMGTAVGAVLGGGQTLGAKAVDSIGKQSENARQSVSGAIQAEPADTIKAEMPEAERYDKLKDKQIRIVSSENTEEHSGEMNSLAELKTKAKSKAEKIIKPLCEKLGIFNKSMKTPTLQMEFRFSRGDLKESIHKQLRYGGSYGDFANTMVNLDKVLENAVLVEVHGDKYAGTSRENKYLENVYVLFGAFKDGNAVIPVQMEIKKTSDTGSHLYMTVTMTKIEADVEGSTIGNSPSRSLVSASECSIAELFSKINPQDAHFLKYLPDQFLSQEQKDAKRAALSEDEKRVAGYQRKDTSLDGGSHGPKAASSGVSSDVSKKVSQTANGPGATPKAESAISVKTGQQSTNTTYSGAKPESATVETSNNSISRPGENVNGKSSETSDMEHGAVGAAESYGENTVGSAQSKFRHEVRQSKVYSNTYSNAKGKDTRAVGKTAREAEPHIAEYDYISEKESVYNARQRVERKGESGSESAFYSVSPDEVMAEYDYLLEKDGWTGEDNDTAMIVLNHLQRQGDIERIKALAKKQRSQGTTGGQLIQSFAKYSRTPTDAMAKAIDELDSYAQSDVPRKFYRNQNFEHWKTEISKAIAKLASEIDNMSPNDVDGMRGIVRQLANFRRTTAWAGRSSRLTRIADKIVDKLDFETAKDIAVKQLAMIPSDFKKRPVGQIVKTIRTQNMLSALTTVNRNLVGNASIGLMDALTDSTVGVAFDVLLSKVTGKRTVASDIQYGKTYFKAATEAAQMAALCAELDIPMESDAAYSIGKTRNYSPQSSTVGRLLSAYEKYMKYALEVTDKFFEGGATATVNSSLQALGEKANLTNAEINSLSQKVGQRRTFKEGRRLAKANTKVKEAINYIGTENFGVGDLAIPFAAVPGEVAQVGIDYSTLGIEGFGEMLKVIRDVKSGKEVDALKQRKAVTDAARGMTGASTIALFTALAFMGIIGVHDDDDYDKQALEQSMGLTGAQFNVDAAIRGLKGESTKWQETDFRIGIDFLEPFNAQMYIGYLMAQEDDIAGMLQEYPKATVYGIAQSVLDMPMMQGLADLENILKSLGEIQEDDWSAVEDAVGQAVGNTATGFIPSWMRQTAQYIDPYYRDTSGENALEKATNQLIASIPFASKTLPIKYNALGEEQLRYTNPVVGFFNTFINPGDVETGTVDEQAYMIADYLAELADTAGTKSIYPEHKAPNSLTVDGEKIQLSGTEKASIYQQTYGENISALYGSLIKDSGFEKLPDALKVEALGKAKEYAKQFAKASVSSYSDVQAGTPDELAKKIITRCISSNMDSAFASLTNAWKYGKDTSGAVSELESAYSIYEGMNTDQRRNVLEESAGRAGAAFQAMSKGVSAQTFTDLYKTYYDIGEGGGTATQKANNWAIQLQSAKEKGTLNSTQVQVMKSNLVYSSGQVAKSDKADQMSSGGLSSSKTQFIIDLVQNIKPESGKTSVSTVQKVEEIAEAPLSKLSEADKKAAMMIYLTDNQGEDLEGMLDMGYDTEDYAHVYRIYTEERDEGGKGTKARTIAAIREELGCSQSVAEAVYKMYNG